MPVDITKHGSKGLLFFLALSLCAALMNSSAPTRCKGFDQHCSCDSQMPQHRMYGAGTVYWR